MDGKRGDDAQDHAPQPDPSRSKGIPTDKQDAANYEERTDGAAIEVEDMNSANDPGAN